MRKYTECHTSVQQEWLTGTQSAAVCRVTQANEENDTQVCVKWKNKHNAKFGRDGTLNY